ncbi:hypothetical protein CR513_04104, partial [Mucuna pruriens]
MSLKGLRERCQGFSYPLLKCLDDKEVEHTIKEVHKRACGTHIKGQVFANKITKAGYLLANT